MHKDLKQKVKYLRAHLASTRNLLIKQIELKNEITAFVLSSEEKLNHTLQQANFPSININMLRKKLADDRRLYAECKIILRKLRADINTTQVEIEKSNRKYHNRFSPQKTGGFFKQKDDGHAPSFSHQAAHVTLHNKPT